MLTLAAPNRRHIASKNPRHEAPKVTTGRRPLFSPPVRPAAQASPGDRLVAFLGRKPPA